MTRFYDIDAANERIPEVREILERLRDQRETLIRLRDEALQRGRAVEAGREGAVGTGRPSAADDGLRRIRLRMQAVIDQMQAAVVRLDEMSISLRDIKSGLIDLPALVNGRQVCLCWRLGEESVEWWHELDAGFAGRRPLIDLA